MFKIYMVSGKTWIVLLRGFFFCNNKRSIQDFSNFHDLRGGVQNAFRAFGRAVLSLSHPEGTRFFVFALRERKTKTTKTECTMLPQAKSQVESTTAQVQ
jgi:hypothetical protein